MERLLEHAEKELAAVGSARFNLGRVLQDANISKSSAYHHFGDREGIIAAVELRHFSRELGALNHALRSFIEAAPDRQAIVGAFRLWAREEGKETGVLSRQRRASAIVAAQSSPGVATMLSEIQRETADFFASTLQILVDRGMISPTLPLRGIAHWVLSVMFARVMVDITNDTAVTTEWVEVAVEAMLWVLDPGRE